MKIFLRVPVVLATVLASALRLLQETSMTQVDPTGS